MNSLSLFLFYPLFPTGYMGVISVLILLSTGMNIYTASQATEGDIAYQVGFLIVFNIIYFGSLFAFAYFWVPTKVTRTVDTLIISFKGASDSILELDDIKEVRVLNTFSCSDYCYMIKNYACRKFFWGVPTSFLKRMVIVTKTCCMNYQISMKDAVMAEFLLDNSPATSSAYVAPDVEAPVVNAMSK